MNIKNTSIVGIGNPLRADDGIAHWVCEQLEKLQMPNVEIFTYQQLQTDQIESWLEYNEIIFVDAATNIKDVQLETISENRANEKNTDEVSTNFREGVYKQSQNNSSSHHLHPSILKALIKELYQKDITITLCKIGASNFSLGESISKETLNNGVIAVSIIKEKLLSYK